MAFLRTDTGFVNLATAIRVKPLENGDQGDGDDLSRWIIYDAEGIAHRFTCPLDVIEEMLNPEDNFLDVLSELNVNLEELSARFGETNLEDDFPKPVVGH